MQMTDSKELLHKLNNQLGVILAHAELIETKAHDASQKARASQVVNAALQAVATEPAHEIVAAPVRYQEKTDSVQDHDLPGIVH